MANTLALRLAGLVVLCMVVGAPIAQAAITCGQVTSNLGPCINYLKSGGVPAAACCNGIKSLQNSAKTTADRQTACKCLKTAASSISGINYSLAAGLPGKCGVSIPYKISPSTDCNTVK
ncbi:non-specific lipid-transfer protein 1-like [Mangifera indica]|uniref:non-specific lipid-transfer protein 1-like n=1 Tax=Mangifera indica TaxID=29780 RepID=UPI001CF9DA44|nr:non-specific lipid-transfer protein 1-like [Mangifera indica]